MAYMQVRGCRVRDSNPHALNVTTSTYAGQAAETEQVSARSMPANDGPDLQSVSNGHRKQATMTPRTAAILDILSAPVAVGQPKRDNPRLALAMWQRKLYNLAA